VLIAGLLLETWFIAQDRPQLGQAELTAGEPPQDQSARTISVPEKLADKNRTVITGSNPPAPTGTSVPAASDLLRPSLPQHYPHIRIAMLAYAGNPMGAFEDKLLQDSVDLVVSNARYLDHVHS